MPTAWLRRRKTMMVLLAMLTLTCFWFWMHTAPWMSVSSSSKRAPIDPDIRKLLREVPGAIPGKTPKRTDVGRQGMPYPSKEELTMLLIEQMQDPEFRVDHGVWNEWRHWLKDGATWPDDAHIQFLTQRQQVSSSGLDDLRLYLESPIGWEMKHLHVAPLTVFSKSYCPYSKAAKALLHEYGATYTAYDVDLRPDAHPIQPLLWYLTGHRTYPKVMTGQKLLGGNDRLQELHERGLLRGILHGAGAL